ncbi:MAG: multicopper oxidase domain-containing protein [Desulfobulbaceae bacterium]
MTNISKSLRVPVILLAAFFSVASPVSAIDLAAVEAEWTPPDSATPIPMWGFIADPGSCPAGPVAWDVGPLQVGSPGATLTINLRNCLSEPVSLIIAGQNATLTPVVQGNRVTAFTHEAPAGGTASYTWNNIKAGTFLYQSGSNPAKQVHMGLYGALTVGTYYQATDEALLLYSEIDPALHATAAAATPLTYKPKYFLINGDAFAAGQAVPVLSANAQVNKNLLLRFVNAGLMAHVPVMQGPHMKIIAEDGNPYPYAREQYSVLLAAGKTLDAVWRPEQSGTYALYDRSLSLSSNGAPGGGMLVYLNVQPFPWILFIPAITGAGL